MNAGNLISGPLPSLNPACTSESTCTSTCTVLVLVHPYKYCRSLAWRILSITLVACEWVQLYGNLNILWHCLTLDKEMATHSSTLAWKMPWTESLVGYSPLGCKELDTTEWLHFTSLELEWKLTLSSLVATAEFSKFVGILSATL